MVLFRFLLQKSNRRLADQFIEDHKHRRQDQDNNDHTDDRASCKQGTDGTNHLNLGVAGYTEGCGEEAEAAADDGRHACFVGNADGFFFVFSVLTLFLVTGCHQDRVIDGCTELDSSCLLYTSPSPRDTR